MGFSLRAPTEDDVEQLFEAIRQVNREGTAVLLVEQFVHLALPNTGRAYVLAKGEVAVEGRSSELLASPDVMAAYLGETAPDTPAESNGSSHGTRAAGAVTTTALLTRPNEGTARSAGEPPSKQVDTEGEGR